MTTLNTIIEEEVERKSEVINDSLWYVNPIHIASAIQRAYEAGQSEERAKIREEVELMPCYLVDARFNPNDPEKMIDTLSRDEVLAKLTPEI